LARPPEFYSKKDVRNIKKKQLESLQMIGDVNIFIKASLDEESESEAEVEVMIAGSTSTLSRIILICD
jgi:hypothetical protein